MGTFQKGTSYLSDLSGLIHLSNQFYLVYIFIVPMSVVFGIDDYISSISIPWEILTC